MRISDWSSDVCSSDLPEEVPNSLESGDGHVFIRLGWGRQSARDLLHDRHPHGDVEIVEDMLGVRPHVPWKLADVPATMGHEGDLPVHADDSPQMQFMKATTPPDVMSDQQAEQSRVLANFSSLTPRDKLLTHQHP